MGIPARQSHMQDMHYIRASMTVAELLAASTAGVQIGTLPAGARVDHTDAYIETVFNAGTTNVLDVGMAADPDGLLPSATLIAGTLGQKTAKPTGQMGIVAVDTPVTVIYAPTGTAATTGLVTVVVYYAPNN